MKNETYSVLVTIIIMLLLAIILGMLTGCGLLWTDQIFAITLGKDFNVGEVYIEDGNDVLWITNYKSDAANAKIKIDPLKRTLEFSIEE